MDLYQALVDEEAPLHPSFPSTHTAVYLRLLAQASPLAATQNVHEGTDAGAMRSAGTHGEYACVCMRTCEDLFYTVKKPTFKTNNNN